MDSSLERSCTGTIVVPARAPRSCGPGRRPQRRPWRAARACAGAASSMARSAARGRSRRASISPSTCAGRTSAAIASCWRSRRSCFFRPFARFRRRRVDVHVLEGATRALLLVRHDPSLDDDGRLCASVLDALCGDLRPASPTHGPEGRRGCRSKQLSDRCPPRHARGPAARSRGAARLGGGVAARRARDAAALSGEARARDGCTPRAATVRCGRASSPMPRCGPGAACSARWSPARAAGFENSAATLLGTTGARRGLRPGRSAAGGTRRRAPAARGLDDRGRPAARSAAGRARSPRARASRRPAGERLRTLVSLPRRHAAPACCCRWRSAIRLRRAAHSPRAARGARRRGPSGGDEDARRPHHRVADRARQRRRAAQRTTLRPSRSPTASCYCCAAATSPARTCRSGIYPFTSPCGATGPSRSARSASIAGSRSGSPSTAALIGRPSELVDAWQTACGEFLHAAVDATARRADGRVHVGVGVGAH